MWFWPGWNRGEAGRVLRFTTPLVGASLLGWVTQNADYVIVGKLMGSISLGLYLLAFNMSGWPQNVLGSVIRAVSLPAFARLREGGAQMEKALCGALRSVSRVMFPVCLFMGALAHPLVLFVYGQHWQPAYAALIGLSINAATRVLLELLTDFLTAMGRTRAILFAQILWLPALVGALLLLVNSFGIAGAGAAQAAVCTGLILPVVVFNVHRAGANWLSVVRAVGPAFAWALAVATLTWFLSTLISEPLLACLVAGATGLSIYVLMYTRDLRQILRQVLDRRSGTRPTLAESPT
jgi:PST family polysaccharide transporter